MHVFMLTDLSQGHQKHNRERTIPSINGVGKTGYPHARERNRTHFIPYTKINVMRIKDFNIRPMWNHKTTRIKHRKNDFDIGLGNIYIYIIYIGNIYIYIYIYINRTLRPETTEEIRREV